MKKFCLVTTLILIIALSASCLVGCDKIKSDDVQGEWFLEQGKLEISGDSAGENGYSSLFFFEHDGYYYVYRLTADEPVDKERYIEDIIGLKN